MVGFLSTIFFGLVMDLLYALLLLWLAPHTGLGFVDGMDYWNWFWVVAIFTGLVSSAITVSRFSEEFS